LGGFILFVESDSLSVTPSAISVWGKQHPRATDRLESWLKIAENAVWSHAPDMKKAFPSVDPVRVKSGRTVYVFNIRQNEFRLVCAVHFNRGLVYMLRFMTHKEYQKGDWKKEL
jgi:mRNA interferase HigB